MLCGLGGASAYAGSPASEFQLWSADPPPNFTLPSSAGPDLALDSARGSVVLVHFFATWCEPCRDELPALNRLSARGKGTVTVLAISVAEVDPRVRRFLETMPLDFAVLLDRDRAVAKSWNVSTLPTTVVLDANLRPRLIVETDFAWDGLDPAGLAATVAAHAGNPASSEDRSTTKPRQGGG